MSLEIFVRQCFRNGIPKLGKRPDLGEQRSAVPVVPEARFQRDGGGHLPAIATQ